MSLANIANILPPHWGIKKEIYTINSHAGVDKFIFALTD